MRKGMRPAWIVMDRFLGINLGADFCAEHEWGIKGIQSVLGIDPKGAPGVKRRSINRDATRYYEGQRHALLVCLRDQWLLDSNECSLLGKRENNPDQLAATRAERAKEFSEKLDTLVGHRDFYHGELNFRWSDPDDDLATAWDGDSFGILVRGKEAIERLREVKKAFEEKDVAIWLGGARVHFFENAGLLVAIPSRLPGEVLDDLHGHDVDAEALQRASEATGIIERLKKADKRFFACRAQWTKGTEKTAHKVIYWLNPMEQDENNCGWFTVEQLDQWIEGKGPIPMKRKKAKS